MRRFDPTGAFPWLAAGCVVAWGVMLAMRGIIGGALEGPIVFWLPALTAVLLVPLNTFAAGLFGAGQPTPLRRRVVGYVGAACFAGAITLPVALLVGFATEQAQLAPDPVDAVLLWNLIALPNEVVQLVAAALIEALATRGGRAPGPA